MIGDLEVFGIDHPDLFYWGQFSPGDEKMIGVAMRYKSNWGFYDAGGADPAPFAKLVDDYPADCVVNGHHSWVTAIIERLQRCVLVADHLSYYCRLPLDAAMPHAAYQARRAMHQDLERLVALYAGAGEMSRDAESIRGCLEHNRIFVTEVEGEIVSAALTNVETSSMAMVGGVYTPQPLRNRGYASAAMRALCASLIQEGIEPCLFYDNPAAGAIYRRLGFVDIGPWRMTKLTHHREE